jgi:hypothetical protein
MVKNAISQPTDRVPDPDPEVADTDPDLALDPVDADAEADLDPGAAADAKEVIPGRGLGQGLRPGDPLGTLDEGEVLPEVDLEVDPRLIDLEVEPEATRETDPSQEVETEGVKFL